TVICFECNKLGNVKAGASEQIELTLHIKIEQALGCAVRRNDTIFEAGLFGGFLKLYPIFVVANLGGRGQRKRKPRALRGIFYLGSKNDVGDVARSQRREILTAFVFENERKSNPADVDANAIRGFVAKHHSNGENPGGVRILFWECGFVLVGVSPGLGGEGHAFVRVEWRGADWWLVGLLLCRRS